MGNGNEELTNDCTDLHLDFIIVIVVTAGIFCLLRCPIVTVSTVLFGLLNQADDFAMPRHCRSN